MKRQPQILVWMMLLACAGCGEDATGVAVDGAVTHNGQEVETGTILFKPNANKNTRGPAVGGTIADGRYSIAPAEGLQAGHYIIRVTPSGPPSRGSTMRGSRKALPDPNEAIEIEREVTGKSVQIDLDF